MSGEEHLELHALAREAEVFKKTALNRDDPRFRQWHGRARQLIARHAAFKLPAFDEIAFASDYFLSKSLGGQNDINDRIALASDLDLALKILADAAALMEQELARAWRERQARAPEAPGSAAPEAADWARLRDAAAAMNFSPRELNDILSELQRLEEELGRAHPGWDSVRRGMKFLLDYDQALALLAVPVILRLYAAKVPPR